MDYSNRVRIPLMAAWKRTLIMMIGFTVLFVVLALMDYYVMNPGWHFANRWGFFLVIGITCVLVIIAHLVFMFQEKHMKRMLNPD